MRFADISVDNRSFPGERRPLSRASVSRDTRRKWIDFVKDHVGQSTDLASIGESAALGLAQVAPRDIQLTLVRAYGESPNLMFAAVLASMDASLEKRTLASLTVQVIDAMQSARNDAREGRYSGLTVDVALLATWVASRTGDDGTWQAIADFILDPKVAASQKASAMDSLSQAGMHAKTHCSRLEATTQRLNCVRRPYVWPQRGIRGRPPATCSQARSLLRERGSRRPDIDGEWKRHRPC